MGEGASSVIFFGVSGGGVTTYDTYSCNPYHDWSCHSEIIVVYKGRLGNDDMIMTPIAVVGILVGIKSISCDKDSEVKMCLWLKVSCGNDHCKNFSDTLNFPICEFAFS